MTRNNDTYINDNAGVVAGEIGQVIINNTVPIRPSIIAAILKLMIDDKVLSADTPNRQSYQIDEKIQYNNVVKYKALIEEYYSFCIVCEQTINKLDNSVPNSKSTIFRSVNAKYKLFKGEFLASVETATDEMKIVRKNADNILDKIASCYLELAERADVLGEYTHEEIELNILAFIVYCFVECKILEKPPQEVL